MKKAFEAMQRVECIHARTKLDCFLSYFENFDADLDSIVLDFIFLEFAEGLFFTGPVYFKSISSYGIRLS